MELLSAVFPVARRDAVVDALIGSEAFSGFNLMAVDGFSRAHGEYDLQEQVAGYRHDCRVDIVIEGEQREALLDLLAAACGPGRLHYWVLPIEATGRR
jgi:hypothetical protein